MVTRVSGRMHGVRARLHRRPTGVTGGGAIAAPGVRRSRIVVALVALTLALALVTVPRAEARPAAGPSVTLLSNADFAYGTYIVDKPGTYRLTEDISFNPNSPAQLTADVANGTIPGWVAGALGWPSPVDAYHSGLPLFTQFLPGGTSDFSPGGPMDAQYDPAAYGIGFFAAIAVTADDVDVLRRFAVRRRSIPADRTEQIAAGLAAKIRPKVIGGDLDELSDTDFLVRVLAQKLK